MPEGTAAGTQDATAGSAVGATGAKQDVQKAPPSTGPGDDKITLARQDYDAQLADRADRSAAKAKKEFLAKFKDAGVTSEEELTALVKAAQDAAAAKLSNEEKATALTKKLEKDLAEATSVAVAAKEEVRRLRMFSAAGVKEHIAVDAELSAAKAEDDKLDEKKWLGDLKKEKPFYFVGAPASGATETKAEKANTGAKTPPIANGNSSPENFNAMTAEPKELQARARALGLDPNLFRG